jgi:hypothetical protein
MTNKPILKIFKSPLYIYPDFILYLFPVKLVAQLFLIHYHGSFHTYNFQKLILYKRIVYKQLICTCINMRKEVTGLINTLIFNLKMQ